MTPRSSSEPAPLPLGRRALAQGRIVAQGLTPTDTGTTPEQIVSGFGAMQGQDLASVVASIALRTAASHPGMSATGAVESVRDAFASGALVRSYPMRSTVFVTTAADAVWIRQLCTPDPLRISARARERYGLTQQALDDIAARTHQLMTRANPAAPSLPRSQLLRLWEREGIAEKNHSYHVLRLLLWQHQLVYGRLDDDNPRDQHLHPGHTLLPEHGARLEDRFNGDEVAATTELLTRYIRSHGPVTLDDFRWWTKISVRTLRAAAEELDRLIARGAVEIASDGAGWYWPAGLLDLVGADASVRRAANDPRLLPAFDELILGYPGRHYIVSPEHHDALVPGNMGVFRSGILAGASIIGTWKRHPLSLNTFEPLSPTRRARLESRAHAYPELHLARRRT